MLAFVFSRGVSKPESAWLAVHDRPFGMRTCLRNVLPQCNWVNVQVVHTMFPRQTRDERQITTLPVKYTWSLRRRRVVQRKGPSSSIRCVTQLKDDDDNQPNDHPRLPTDLGERCTFNYARRPKVNVLSKTLRLKVVAVVFVFTVFSTAKRSKTRRCSRADQSFCPLKGERLHIERVASYQKRVSRDRANMKLLGGHMRPRGELTRMRCKSPQ